MFERDRHPDYQPDQLSKWLSGGVGIVMLIIGAIMHQTARSLGSMENAKSVMTRAMIGLAIACWR